MLDVDVTPSTEMRMRRAWLRIFLVGLALWLTAAAVGAAGRDTSCWS